MLERSIPSHQSQEKGHQFRAIKCDGAHFQRDCSASKNAGKQSSGKHNQGKSWSKSESSIPGREDGQENNGKPKGKSQGTEGAIQVKTLKTGISDLENLKSETSTENQESVQMGQVCTTETSWIHEEWSPDEWNEDGSCVGWHEDCERRCCTTVSSFSLESSERMNANLDTRATVDLSLVKFDREGVGDGSSYDWITEVEAWRFQGTDAHQLLGSNASAFATAPAALDVHEVLCSAAEIACKEQQESFQLQFCFVALRLTVHVDLHSNVRFSNRIVKISFSCQFKINSKV